MIPLFLIIQSCAGFTFSCINPHPRLFVFHTQFEEEPPQMKNRPLTAAICIAASLLFASVSHGRIGENYGQCVARYGKAVAALPGLGHILGVAEFEKGGIAVTALFDKANRQCFLIMYSRVGAARILGPAELKEAGIDSLMASINTTWQEIEENGSSFRSSRVDSTSKGKVPAKKDWKEIMAIAEKAAAAFYSAVDAGRIAHLHAPDHKCQTLFDNFPTYGWLKPYRRSGDRIFAFTIWTGTFKGLLLINPDAARAITSWAEAYEQSLKQDKDKGRPLEGF